MSHAIFGCLNINGVSCVFYGNPVEISRTKANFLYKIYMVVQALCLEGPLLVSCSDVTLFKFLINFEQKVPPLSLWPGPQSCSQSCLGVLRGRPGPLRSERLPQSVTPLPCSVQVLVWPLAGCILCAEQLSCAFFLGIVFFHSIWL